MIRKASFFIIAALIAVSATDWDNATSAQDTKAKAKGRLPAYYTKVDVDDKQREAIYKIQADYEPKLDKLEAELKTLREKRDADLRDVLTKAQQKLLDEAVEESKSKSKTKAKTTEKMEKSEKAEKADKEKAK